MRHTLFIYIAAGLLTVACGKSYKETKRIAQENRKEAMRRDSAALKVAVMPTLDCLPLFVAQHHQLFDTLQGGVRLKMFNAQMDCDTALERHRVEGSMTDLIRARRMEAGGLKLRYAAVTNSHWLLTANRTARVREPKQLEDKMVAMTRLSATDMLTDMVVDSAKADGERVFRVQINDLGVRMLMLRNNEMDAMWLPEPQATEARLMKHNIVADSRRMGLTAGVMVFNETEMLRPERASQMQMFLKAYNQACDSINKNGLHRYRSIIVERCGVSRAAADSLPKGLTFSHTHGPAEKDITAVDRWLASRAGQSPQAERAGRASQNVARKQKGRK